MLNKKSGFTLIEMIVTVAIASILMLLATDVIMKNIIKANNDNNNSVDIQVGVKNTLDSIKNALKSSTQAHIVGENVFKKNMTKSDLANLDSRYKDNSVGDKFTIVPIISLGKNDSLSPVKTTYTMEFYKNDKNYNEKLKNKILNLTVKGVSQPIDSNGNVKTNEKPKEFELTSDISLPNANQLMISKYLEGSIKDATAIAYDNFQIGQGNVTSNDMSIVLVVDQSNSMKFALGGEENGVMQPIYKILNTTEYMVVNSNTWRLTNDTHANHHNFPFNVVKTFANKEKLMESSKYSPRKYLAQLALNGFVNDLNRLGSGGSKLDLYMFYYNTKLQHDEPSDVSNGKYIYLKEDMSEYGPYKLDGSSESAKAIEKDIVEKLKLGFMPEDYQFIGKNYNGNYRYVGHNETYYGATNTAKAKRRSKTKESTCVYYGWRAYSIVWEI